MDKVVFLDRDGTINVEKNYLYKTEDFEFIPGSEDAIRLLNRSGYKVIVVTNQAGVARGYYTEDDVAVLHAYINERLKEKDAYIDKFIYCPHHPVKGIGEYKCKCRCRKPDIGMFEQAAGIYDIDKSNSWMVGDNVGDMDAGMNFGIRTILVSTGYGSMVMSGHQAQYDYYKKNLYEAAAFITEYGG